MRYTSSPHIPLLPEFSDITLLRDTVFNPETPSLFICEHNHLILHLQCPYCKTMFTRKQHEIRHNFAKNNKTNEPLYCSPQCRHNFAVDKNKRKDEIRHIKRKKVKQLLSITT